VAGRARAGPVVSGVRRGRRLTGEWAWALACGTGPSGVTRGAGARSERRWLEGATGRGGVRIARLPARWGQGTGGAGGCARAGLVERERGLNGGRRARASGARAAGENACARLSPEREGARERAALEEMGLGREWSGRGGARLGPRMRERRPVGLG
jgi:hypothetical protein